MDKDFVKYDKCNCIKSKKCRLQAKNYKQIILKSPLDYGEYLCLKEYLKVKSLYKKVRKSVNKMSNKEVVSMMDNVASTLKYTVIKREWNDIKSNKYK